MSLYPSLSQKNVVISELKYMGEIGKGEGTGKKCRYNRNVARGEVARGEFNCTIISVIRLLSLFLSHVSWTKARWILWSTRYDITSGIFFLIDLVFRLITLILPCVELRPFLLECKLYAFKEPVFPSWQWDNEYLKQHGRHFADIAQPCLKDSLYIGAY